MKNQINVTSSHARYQVLTGFSLKVIGIILMIIDHLYEMFHFLGVPIIFHMIGRVCLPIFLYMAAEGFHYTHNRKKYMLRLLIGFWLMGIANMVLTQLLFLEDITLINNIFGTMFLSTFYMWMINLLKDSAKQKKIAVCILAIAGMFLPILSFVIITSLVNVSMPVASAAMILLPSIFITEGGFTAVLLSILFYLLRRFGRFIQMIPLILLSIMSAFGGDNVQWIMVFSVIPLLMYNGKPGKKSKWFFYIFYPAHIYLFYIVSYLMH